MILFIIKNFVPSEARALTDGLCMAKDQCCQHIQVEGESKLLIDSIYNLWLYFYCLEDKIVIERYSSPLDHIVFFCSLMCLD